MPSWFTRNVTSTCANCAGIGGMPRELERAKEAAVLRQFALALVDVEQDRGLVVRGVV